MRTILRLVISLSTVELFFGWPALLPTQAAGVEKSEWGIAYYLPHDNNLSRLAEGVVAAIRQGSRSSSTIVAIQLDLAGKGGMQRLVVSPVPEENRILRQENSAYEEEVARYFEWFAERFSCQKYALFILGHGGRHDELSYDGFPGPAGRKWMSGKVLGERLRKVQLGADASWELLFFEQCGRASLENLYSVRGTAKYILASPVRVRAPSDYYTPFHQWLGETRGATGLQLAESICRFDHSYSIYSCVLGDKLAELPRRVDALLLPFLDNSRVIQSNRCSVIYSDGSEPVVDAQSYFEGLAAANEAGQSEVPAFSRWLQTELLAHVWRASRNPAEPDALCGVSFFAPTTPRTAVRYQGLDFYRDCELPKLWKQITTGE